MRYISGVHVHHDKTFRKTARRVELRDANFTQLTTPRVPCLMINHLKDVQFAKYWALVNSMLRRKTV